MKFNEAFNLMKNGIPVRRPSWATGAHIRYHEIGGDKWFSLYQDTSVMKVTYGLSAEGVDASDWEIYQVEIEANPKAVWSALIEGKKLSRKSWAPGTYIHCDFDGFLRCNKGKLYSLILHNLEGWYEVVD